MGTCLVTTLKDAVSDNALLKLGELEFEVDSSVVSEIYTDSDMEIIGDGYFTSEDGTANYGKTHFMSQGLLAKFSPGKYKVVIKNKYSTTKIVFNYQPALKFNVAELEYSQNLWQFRAPGGKVYGNGNKLPSSITDLDIQYPATGYGISIDLSSLTNQNMTTIVLEGNDTSGNLSSVADKLELVSLVLANCRKVTGNLSSLSSLTNLQLLSLGNTSVEGNLSSIAGLTDMETYLGVQNTGVTGNLSSLANMTKLKLLDIGGTSISGDTSQLAGLTNLTNFWYGNCPNITGTWPLT